MAGRADLIGRVAARLYAPGVGIDAGGVSGSTLRIFFQGLFLAPQTTGEALKGGRLVAEVGPQSAWGAGGAGRCWLGLAGLRSRGGAAVGPPWAACAGHALAGGPDARYDSSCPSRWSCPAVLLGGVGWTPECHTRARYLPRPRPPS